MMSTQSYGGDAVQVGSCGSGVSTQDFWNDDKTKKSEFDLGSAFFRISEVDFLPTGTE